MRVFFNELSDSWENLSQCHTQMVQIVVNHFDSLETRKAIQGKSGSLRNHLSKLSKSGEVFETGFRANSKVKVSNRGAPDRASFLLDLQIECTSACDVTHVLNVELCLNNREAIGTNILKPEIMARSSVNQLHAGMLICPSRSLLLSGNWDASYGDDSEYLVAYKLVYEPVLEHPLGLLQLSD